MIEKESLNLLTWFYYHLRSLQGYICPNSADRIWSSPRLIWADFAQIFFVGDRLIGKYFKSKFYDLSIVKALLSKQCTHS